ncbi:hypothetical protein E4U21_004731 [Claviceps maximensis]|nr:hypothetical protein E4U21_004731 [Claviceps maximensis]
MPIAPPDRGFSELGAFENLPVELINKIVSFLDLVSLSRFKAANLRIFNIVYAHCQFRMLIREARPLISGFFAVKLAHTVTVEELFFALRESRCVECGDFGGFMYLFTLERVCTWCVERTDRFFAVRERDALEEFGLSLEKLDLMPRMESFPIRVFGNGPIEGVYLPVFDRATIIKALGTRAESSDGSIQAASRESVDPEILQSYKDRIEEREIRHDEQRFRKWRRDQEAGKARSQKKNAAHAMKRAEAQRKLEAEKAAGIASATSDDNDGVSEDDDMGQWPVLEPEEIALPKALQEAKEDRERFEHSIRLARNRIEDKCLIAVCRAPWLNKKTQTAEWGFHCFACLDMERTRLRMQDAPDYDKATYFRRQFLVSTFEEHLDEFDPKRIGRHQFGECCSEDPCYPETHTQRNRGLICHRFFWLS